MAEQPGQDPLLELGGDKGALTERQKLQLGVEKAPKALTLDERMAKGEARGWVRNTGQPTATVDDETLARWAEPSIVGTVWQRRTHRTPEKPERYTVIEFADSGMSPMSKPSMILFGGQPCVRVKGHWRAAQEWVWSLRRFMEICRPVNGEPGQATLS